MKLIQTLNPEGVTEEEAASYRIRTTVRAIVYDKDGDIAVLNVSKWKYHKLPGGGVNDGEDVNGALKRECREELGCEIDMYNELVRDLREAFPQIIIGGR